MKCPRHPDIETNITCANCGQPICPKCMVYTPVGLKCPDCARQRGRAVAGPPAVYYVRAAGVGLGSALIVGLILAELRTMGFGALLITVFAGMAVGEAVSRAARRNTGRAFEAIAGLSAALAFFLAGYFTGFPVLSVRGLHGIAFLGISPARWLFALLGIYMAVYRLKE